MQRRGDFARVHRLAQVERCRWREEDPVSAMTGGEPEVLDLFRWPEDRLVRERDRSKSCPQIIEREVINPRHRLPRTPQELEDAASGQPFVKSHLLHRRADDELSIRSGDHVSVRSADHHLAQRLAIRHIQRDHLTTYRANVREVSLDDPSELSRPSARRGEHRVG